MRMLNWLLIVASLGFFGCRGCIEQHDPRGDWKRFEEESNNARKPEPKLTQDGKIPPAVVAEDTTPKDPIDEKYAAFCSTCHGPEGKGDGAAAASLNPKPRNFVAWKDASVTDDYIAKVIREGGAAVGKSPTMAAWGGVLSADEIAGLVKKIRKFEGK